MSPSLTALGAMLDKGSAALSRRVVVEVGERPSREEEVRLSKGSVKSSLSQSLTQAMKPTLGEKGEKKKKKLGSGPLSKLPWRPGLIPSCLCNLPCLLQAVLQMEQRKQQQQNQNSPAPGPEGQLQFHPDTGAGGGGLGTPGGGSWWPILGSEGGRSWSA